MSANIVIVGEGLLADYVYDHVSAQYSVECQRNFNDGVPKEIDLALVLHDAWNPSLHRVSEEVFRRSNTPWLRGFVSFGEGVVGPFVRPEAQGCSQCADLRRIMAGHQDRREMWRIHQGILDGKEIKRDAWASQQGLSQMAHLIKSETEKILQGRPSNLEEKLFIINLKTLKSSYHFFLPDPLCPICSHLPKDSPTLAQISLQSSPKIKPDSYRSRSLNDLKDILQKDYLDSRTGLLNGKTSSSVVPFASTGVHLPLFNGDGTAGGRSHSFAESEPAAILEGIERYCGMEPRGKRTIVYDSYDHLADQALHPAKVGLYSKEQYAAPHFPFKPFDPTSPINWVWGYSFLQERPILVPETLAYYNLDSDEYFISDTSNGCALGGSFEEAIFYGIMEVIERDSFLMTWYAQLPLQPIDLRSIQDQELKLMIDRVKAVGGYDIYLFNATMENRIPAVWTLAKNRKKEGVNLICAGGAHLDPIKAAKGSVHEFASSMLLLDEKYESNKEKYRNMLKDPFLVQKMEDHGMLYGVPEAEERLDFLLKSDRPLRTFEEEFKWEKKNAGSYG